jgi:hypothetical protein
MREVVSRMYADSFCEAPADTPGFFVSCWEAGWNRLQARNVSGAIGRRVTGGVATGAASAGFAFCWVGAACLRWSELAAPADKAGSSRNAIAKIIDFFMGHHLNERIAT